MSHDDQGGLAGFVRDPEAARERVQQWAKSFEAKAERYQAVQASTERLRLSAGNADGSVRVTVRADGTVSDLRFTEKVRTLPPAELSAQILATMRTAQSGIASTVGEVVAEQLGDEDEQTRAVMLDNLRERFPEPEEGEVDEPDSDKWDNPEVAAPVADEPTASPPPPAQPVLRQPPPQPPRRPQPHDDEDDDFDPLRD